MTKLDRLRIRIKALKGKKFTSYELRDGDDDVNSHVRMWQLVKNGEIVAVGKTRNFGQPATVYQEANLRAVGLPTRLPGPPKRAEDESPWAGTWLERPIPAAYLSGKKTVHYGLSANLPGDDE